MGGEAGRAPSGGLRSCACSRTGWGRHHHHHETLQATSHSGHNGRGQAKAQTKLTCAVSQAERILNMCEIGYDIHISLNFSFKFGGIIPILLNIKPG